MDRNANVKIPTLQNKGKKGVKEKKEKQCVMCSEYRFKLTWVIYWSSKKRKDNYMNFHIQGVEKAINQ